MWADWFARRRLTAGFRSPYRRLFASAAGGRPICSALVAVILGGAGSLFIQVNASEPTVKNQEEMFARDAATVAVKQVVIGFRGHGKLGFFLPVSVTLQCAQAVDSLEVLVIAPDSEGILCEFADQEVYRLEPNIPRTITARAKIGRKQGPVRVVVRQAEKTLAVWEAPNEGCQRLVKGTQELLLVQGDALDVPQALRFRPQTDDMELDVAKLDTWDELPSDPLLMAGVDAILLTTSTSSSLPTNRWKQIAEYVAQGGRLLVSCGSQGQALLTETGALKELVPSEFARVRNQRDTTGLEGFAGASERIDLVLPAEGGGFGGVETSQLASERGVVEAFDGSGDQRVAWIVRSRFGFGMVTLLTADLESYPLSQWPGRHRLIARLLDVTLGKTPDSDIGMSSSVVGELGQLGFRDLAGQLRMALDYFPGVSTIPFSAILTAVVVGILAVSLGDYFVSHRLFRVPLMTWLTLPVVVTGICWGMVWFATGAKGKIDRLNHLEIIDVDLLQGRMRGSHWLRIFSHAPQEVSFEVEPNPGQLYSDSKIQALECSWMGLPGGGLGGMDSSAGNTFPAPFYRCRGTAQSATMKWTLTSFKLPQWASRGFVSSWSGTFPSRDVAPLMVNSSDRVTGRISNPLGVKMRDCILFHGEWCYDLGTLEPEGEIVLEDSTPLKDASAWLTRRQIVDDKEITPAWDKMGHDVPRIAEMLMFHEAAGGVGYTELVDRFYRRIDASEIVQLDAAVLVGRLDRSGTRIVGADPEAPLAAEQKNWSYVRIYLPALRMRSPGLRP